MNIFRLCSSSSINFISSSGLCKHKIENLPDVAKIFAKKLKAKVAELKESRKQLMLSEKEMKRNLADNQFQAVAAKSEIERITAEQVRVAFVVTHIPGHYV